MRRFHWTIGNICQCRRVRSAFTLIELLTVLGVISLLVALLLPALTQARGKAHAAACQRNLKELGLAFFLYWGDNRDVFPTAALRSSIGPQPEDWIWWQVPVNPSGQPSMRNAHHSAIVPYLGNYDTRYLRCPSDMDALLREMTWKISQSTELYTYSYTLNAHSPNGMASYISKDRSEIRLNKQSAISRPSQKIMLAEEKGSASDGPGTAVINDGAWQPLGYPLTSRHAGRANVTFADGHIESVHRDFARSERPEHFDPAY